MKIPVKVYTEINTITVEEVLLLGINDRIVNEGGRQYIVEVLA